MSRKETIIKTICVILAALLFAAGLVVFYLRNERESEQNLDRTPAATQAYVYTTASEPLAAVNDRAYPIDINKADIDDLVSVDGIGETTAHKIISYRQEKGTIHDIAELSTIDGIGEETCELLSKYFFVEKAEFVEFTTTAATAATTHKKTETTAPKETTTRKTTTTAGKPEPAQFPIDINKVTADELVQIDGVGEGLAGKIIALRTQKGRITDMEQLLEIHGIGQSTLDMLCRYLYVDSKDYSKASSATTQTKATTTASQTQTKTAAQTTSQTTAERQKRRVDINKADAAEIADALLIEREAADMIVWLREQMGGYSNTLEVLFLEEFDKRYDAEFYNSIKDYIYIGDEK